MARIKCRICIEWREENAKDAELICPYCSFKFCKNCSKILEVYFEDFNFGICPNCGKFYKEEESPKNILTKAEKLP